MCAAPRGNDYNLKWTVEKSKEFFDEVEAMLIENEEVYTLSEAVTEVGEYEELVSYLINKYPDEDFKSIKRAKDICKDRLIRQGLKNKVNVAMAIFVLKNNHGMADKTDSNVNVVAEQPLFPDE